MVTDKTVTRMCKLDMDVEHLMQVIDHSLEEEVQTLIAGGRPLMSSAIRVGDAVRTLLRVRLAEEIATLSVSIAQLEAGDSAGTLKMLRSRVATLTN